MLNKKLIKIQGDIIDLEAIYMISEIKDDCFDIFFYNTEIPKTVEFNIDYINSEFKNILNKRGLLNELRSEHIDWKTGKFLSDITYETYEKERVELRELESKNKNLNYQKLINLREKLINELTTQEIKEFTL